MLLRGDLAYSAIPRWMFAPQYLPVVMCSYLITSPSYQSISSTPWQKPKTPLHMRFSKSKWLAYTFLVGLIPVLTRLVVWTATKIGTVNALAAPDFVAFGLVLHISIINELEHVPPKERNWKTIQNGASLIFITLYSTLYVMTIFAEKSVNLIDGTVMLRSSMAFAIVSTLLSLAVFHRLSKLTSR